MSKRVTIEEIKERLKKVHGDTVVLDESTYVNTQTKCRFIDKEYGEWFAVPKYVVNDGTGHPKRGLVKQGKSHTISINIIKEKLYKVHGNIVSIDESTYINTHTKCRFIDIEFGSWWALPTNVVYSGTSHNKRRNKKSEQTCLKRYGVKHPLQNEKIKEKFEQTCLKNHGVKNPSQNLEIALKQAKAQNNSYILIHWKTNKEIICIAGYEKATIEYFNDNRIDYEWQYKAFPMVLLSGKKATFRPDCYLPDQDLWIEIKGYFRDDAKEKWDWFHKEHPNSELWNKEKLKEMKIL